MTGQSTFAYNSGSANRGGFLNPTDNSVCVLPWNHLATHPMGMVSLCCRAVLQDGSGFAKSQKFDGTLGARFLAQHGLSEIINSDTHRKVRLQMLEGGRPPACAGCFQDEDRGMKSKRQTENEIYGPLNVEQLRRITRTSGEITPRLRFVELRLGRTCNLKCRTCNPASSSAWESDYAKLQSELNFIRPFKNDGRGDWSESDSFWQELLEYGPEIEVLYINGGEPTLNQKHWWYLRELVRTGRASQVTLNYHTNMTHLPSFAIPLWQEFKYVKVGASIDDMYQRNSYLRSSVDWNTVVTNLRRVRDAGFEAEITQTVSAYNLFYLDELWNFGVQENVHVDHNFVYDPEFLSVAALPTNLRDSALHKLKSSLPHDIYERVALKTRGPDRPELWSKFLSYTQALDKMRRESFAQLFPELQAE